jgi:hypothetical protein
MTSPPEHDEVHGLLAQIVVFVQVVFDNMTQLFKISDFDIVLGVRFCVAEVAEHETAEIVLGDFAVAVAVKVDEETVEIFAKTRLGDFFDERKEPGTILIVNQSVVENAESLNVMHQKPKTYAETVKSLVHDELNPLKPHCG